jgi:hypothetical protein
MTRLFDQETDAARAMDKYQVQDANYRGEITRKERMFDAVVARLEEISVSMELGNIKTQVIHPPGRGYQTAPDMKKSLTTAGILGLLAGLGLAFVIDSLDRRFRNPDDIRNELGVPIVRHPIADADGIETGWEWEHPIKDLERDLGLLKPAVCSVDRESTWAWQAFLDELLGDALPVVIRTGCFGNTMLTYRVVELMGMQAYFMAMLDAPDEVHRLMAFLRDNALRVMRWAEAEGLLRLNNGNQDSFGSSYNFTTKLPAPGYDGESVRLRDMWGNANSQETVGISPRMYHDFCAPYYAEVCAPVGLVYYGCCEPAHPFWDDISAYPNLKKVSISRWCDESMMGEALRGTEIVFSRKPDPNFLSVDKRLNEEAWAAHIRDTLKATRGVFTEFIIRDVYTVHGNLGNARRAVEIAREEIDR